MSESKEVIIKTEGVRVNFGDFWALKGIDIEVTKGEIIVILGPSGSGKSTFIRTLNRLQPHSGGTIEIDGIMVDDDTTIKDLKYIRSEIGFVFQHFNLLDHLTAVENVALPSYFGTSDVKGAPRARAVEALTALGLGDKLDEKPTNLSGGQKQRVAIARALFFKPKLLLCDEPTGSLDSKIGQQIIETFQDLNQKGYTIVIITHEDRVSEAARRIIRLEDGEIVSDTRTDK